MQEPLCESRRRKHVFLKPVLLSKAESCESTLSFSIPFNQLVLQHTRFGVCSFPHHPCVFYRFYIFPQVCVCTLPTFLCFYQPFVLCLIFFCSPSFSFLSVFLAYCVLLTFFQLCSSVCPHSILHLCCEAKSFFSP